MAHCNYQIGIFKYENNLIFFCNASYKYDSTNGKKNIKNVEQYHIYWANYKE